jgi:hypothetical protein
MQNSIAKNDMWFDNFKIILACAFLIIVGKTNAKIRPIAGNYTLFSRMFAHLIDMKFIN